MSDTTHLDDALSALVDGELELHETEAAQSHLQACAACRAELEATTAIARAVRALPMVAPSAAAIAAFRPRRPHHRRPALAGLAAAAMVAVAFGLGGQLEGAQAQVAPPVDDMIDRHQAALLPVAGDDTGEDGFAAARRDDMDAAFRAPREMGDLDRSAVYHRDDVLHVMYGPPASGVSVFEQAGELDADGLPDDMDPMGEGAWLMDEHGVHAVVVDGDRLVFTVVGSGPMPETMAVVHDLPSSPSPSLLQRARDAGAEVVWTFGFGG